MCLLLRFDILGLFKDLLSLLIDYLLRLLACCVGVSVLDSGVPKELTSVFSMGSSGSKSASVSCSFPSSVSL